MSDSRKEIITTETLQLQEKELTQQILRYAHDSEYSFAVWRLPNEISTNLIVSFSQLSFSKETILEDLPEGFLFSPFDNQKDGSFLQADLSFTFSHGKLNEPSTPLQSDSFNKLSEILSENSRKQTTFSC